MQPQFIEVPGLYELEQQGRWDEARRFLLAQWGEEKSSCDRLCRAAFECWYIIAEWDCLFSDLDLAYSDFKETLIDLTEFGLANFSAHTRFLWLFGYMITLFPFLFYEENDDKLFSQWEQRGKEMLFRAFSIDPNNPLIKAAYFSQIVDGTMANTRKEVREYRLSIIDLNPILLELFPGNTIAEKYFREVFGKQWVG